jgi:Outer membrane protein Omp28
MYKSTNFASLFSTTLSMKKTLLLATGLLFALALSAQTSAKKYVLIEHFTNSKCGICASKNPTFYNLINQAQYADQVHHISIHPPVPYNTCVFYLGNPTENNAWATLFGISGTPRVAVDGHLIPSGSQLLRQDTLAKYLNLTSPLYLRVTESGVGNTRNASIDARALSQIPAGNYKLFVAVAEKAINLVTPNGEAVHHDVFRDMLTPVTGQDFTPPAPGQNSNFNFTYTIDPAWSSDQVYVLAFVKNIDTKQVLNSATKFDASLSETGEPATHGIRFSPNPASQVTFAEIGDDFALRTEVFSTGGQRVYDANNHREKTVVIPTEWLTSGLYFVKITGEKGIYTARMVKQ